jgi:hypothetical protein
VAGSSSTDRAKRGFDRIQPTLKGIDEGSLDYRQTVRFHTELRWTKCFFCFTFGLQDWEG